MENTINCEHPQGVQGEPSRFPIFSEIRGVSDECLGDSLSQDPLTSGLSSPDRPTQDSDRHQQFLSGVEAQRRLGISYPTLLRHVRDHLVPVVKIGSRLLFPRSYFVALEREAYASVKGGVE